MQQRKKKTRLISIVNLAMALMIGYLGFKINEKNQWFNQFPYQQTFRLTNWFPYEKWLGNDSQPVSATPLYQQLVDDMYISESDQVKMIADGIVLSHDEQSIQILQDNGIEASYSHMNHVLVKDDERLYAGSLLGTYEDFVMLQFTKNEEKMDYESVRVLP